MRPVRRVPSLALTRLLYNAHLERRLAGLAADLVVGFDMDGCLLRRIPAPRYIVSLKGVMADEERFERGVSRLGFRFLSRLERRNARHADVVVTTSRYSAERAIAAYALDPARLRVVPEGIDAKAWEQLPPGRPRSGPVVLSVARQYRRKNTATLLRAMRHLRERVPEASLRIVGDGPELPALRRLAARLRLGPAQVTFLGALKDEAEVRREYASADVFCLPSRQEGFGIVFLEAMAAGLPIVAARAGAVPEIAPEGEVALLVPPDDELALAEALLAVLQDPALRQRLSYGGRTRWKAYGWSAVARRFLHAVGAEWGA